MWTTKSGCVLDNSNDYFDTEISVKDLWKIELFFISISIFILSFVEKSFWEWFENFLFYKTFVHEFKNFCSTIIFELCESKKLKIRFGNISFSESRRVNNNSSSVILNVVIKCFWSIPGSLFSKFSWEIRFVGCFSLPLRSVVRPLVFHVFLFFRICALGGRSCTFLLG